MTKGYYHLIEKTDKIKFGDLTKALYFLEIRYVNELFWEAGRGFQEIP